MIDVPFRGSLVALPTPFTGDALDLDAFERLVDDHARRGTHGVVVAGTTGESATLSDVERGALVRAAVSAAAGRLAVIAGVGTNCTRTSADLARAATRAGADGLLAVTPYYNRPSPRGLERHIAVLAGAGDRPLVLYNVPSRTGCDMSVALVERLCQAHATIVGLKEATERVERVRWLAERGVAVWCGEDGRLADFLAAGAVGAVGVVGNLVPERVVELIAASLRGDLHRAQALQAELDPLVSALFVESNPVPVKTALELLGRCRATVRAPLAELEEASRTTLEAALRTAGLLVAAVGR
jgi:4-hydroxy-tetrahydrodipicolinate synthase